MKLHPVPRDLESGTPLPRHHKAIQRVIHQILDSATAQADQVVMQGHIGVKARAVMPIVDLPDEPCVPQHTQRVIHRIRGDHRVDLGHLPMQIFGCWMARGFNQSLIDRRPLGRHLQAAGLEPLPDFVWSNFHCIPV